MLKRQKVSEVVTYIAAAASLALAVALVAHSQSDASPFISSELGIATFSPGGQTGGAMMPASGCTGSESGCGGTVTDDGYTCSLTLTPGYVDAGENIQATVNQSSVLFGTTPPPPGAQFTFNRCWNDLTNCVPMGATNQFSNTQTITTDLGEDFRDDKSYVVDATMRWNGMCGTSESGTYSCTKIASCVSAFTVNDQPACSDGVDNADADTLADADDPGCHTDGDATDGDDTYDPLDPSEADAPAVVVEACNIGGANCEDVSKTIVGSQQVRIKWTTTNAWTCNPLAGPSDFFDSYATSSASGTLGMILSGYDTTVTEPNAGDSLSYTLECDNGAGETVLDSVVVVRDLAQCQDSIDNDGDGFTDYPSDPSCSSSTDNTETPIECSNPSASNYRAAGSCIFACNDGSDNDGDGLTDHPADPGCSSPTDNNEFNAPPDGDPTISATPSVVRAEQTYELSWDPDISANCTLSSNVNDGSGVPDATVAGSITLTAERTMTHTISCDGGDEASVQITVLPNLFET